MSDPKVSDPVLQFAWKLRCKMKFKAAKLFCDAVTATGGMQAKTARELLRNVGPQKMLSQDSAIDAVADEIFATAILLVCGDTSIEWIHPPNGPAGPLIYADDCRLGTGDYFKFPDMQALSESVDKCKS